MTSRISDQLALVDALARRGDVLRGKARRKWFASMDELRRQIRNGGMAVQGSPAEFDAMIERLEAGAPIEIGGGK